MTDVSTQIEYMLKNVAKGVKRLDLTLTLEGKSYEASCYPVVDIIRLDLKPLGTKERRSPSLEQDDNICPIHHVAYRKYNFGWAHPPIEKGEKWCRK